MISVRLRFAFPAALLAARLAWSGPPPADEYLTHLYDGLHDSPMQRKIRDLAPMPFGVVFLPWKGMSEPQMREQFQLMQKLGFHNLKQVLGSAEWPDERIMEVAAEEGLIPFWYGEAGWEAITPELLARLGIPAKTPKNEIRRHPKMVAYQMGVIRRGIRNDSGRPFLGGDKDDAANFQHTPDPFVHKDDVPRLQKWLRSNYASPEEINQAWNLYEVGIEPRPFKSWDDVDRAVGMLARQPDNLGGYGREYGRVRDVLRYKAESRARQVEESSRRMNALVPEAPTRTGGEMGLFLPFAWRATNMELLANTQTATGSFYPSIHFAWHFGEVNYEVARTIYMQSSLATDLFKGGWAGAWESTGGPQQTSGAKGWNQEQASTIAGFTVNAGTMAQLFLSYLAGGFKGAGVWSWNYRPAGIEGGEYALVDRQLRPSDRAVRAGQIAQAAERLRDEIWQAHKEPYVGVLYNWDSDAIWAAISIRGRDGFRHYPMEARVGVSRSLINGNVPWEHVTPTDIARGLAPRYKIIYLPAQMALTEPLLKDLLAYAKQGGRVVIDAPGGWYDEHGLVLNTGAGSAFEQLFGAEITDFQYSSNVPRLLDSQRLSGFILALHPTAARVVARFQTGEPAVVENLIGKGSAAILAWDASHACFRPGDLGMEARLRKALLGSLSSPYACDGAVVYRLAAPSADHYFFINDGEARKVSLDTRKYHYEGIEDPVTGEHMSAGEPITLDAYSGRWLRYRKH